MAIDNMEDELQSTIVEINTHEDNVRSVSILEITLHCNKTKKTVCAWNFSPALSRTIFFLRDTVMPRHPQSGIQRSHG